jgi:hypothetical protein
MWYKTSDERVIVGRIADQAVPGELISLEPRRIQKCAVVESRVMDLSQLVSRTGELTNAAHDLEVGVQAKVHVVSWIILLLEGGVHLARADEGLADRAHYR